MSGGSLVYSNARVKALENTVLSAEKTTRLAFADSLDEGIRILYESNYGNGLTLSDINDFGLLLEAEDEKITSFFRETMIAGSGMEAFLKENDYHNAKALTKAKYLRAENADDMLKPSGTVDVEALKAAIAEDSYAQLPKFMAEALAFIDSEFADGRRSPRLIDVALDKALYSDVSNTVKKARDKSIKEYFSAKADTANISTLVRCKRSGMSAKEFGDSFLDGGKIDKQTLLSLYDLPVEEIMDKLRYKEIGKVVVEGIDDFIKTGNLVRYETETDNYYIDLFRKDKNDVFSVAPLLGFYIAKKIEIKVVRMILVCLKNGIDKQIIKKRLRDFYA